MLQNDTWLIDFCDAIFRLREGGMGDLGEFWPIVQPIKCSTFASVLPGPPVIKPSGGH